MQVKLLIKTWEKYLMMDHDLMNQAAQIERRKLTFLCDIAVEVCASCLLDRISKSKVY